MTDRQKIICDHIMYSIYSSSAQTKFGLSGMATMFDGKASDKEVAEAVQYLLDKNYIRRMQGRNVVGRADDEEIRYDLTGFDPFSRLPAIEEKPETEIAPDAYKGEPKSVKRPSLTELGGKSKAPAKVDEEPEQSAAGESSEEPQPTTPREKGMIEREFERQERLNIENIPTLFGIKDQARKGDSAGVFDAIDRLKKQLKPQRIPDVALKLAVLSELAETLDPSISHVLKDIQADYRSHSFN